jgi:predicted lipoprotein
MKRVVVFLFVVALASGVFWKFPLFHIVRSAEREISRSDTAFDAVAFAESFWKEKLIPSLHDDPEVPDAASLMGALRENPKAARRQFGRKVGISRTRLFILRGSGVVVSADRNGIGIALQSRASAADIVLHAGPVFGNIVRDVSGMLDPSDFANSQHFNDISTGLNRIVEARVIPRVKQLATSGQKIAFVGCAEVPDDWRIDQPLKVIPLEVSAN